jgi:hypothetical protein
MHFGCMNLRLIQGHIGIIKLAIISLLPSGIFLLLSGASSAGPGWRVRTKVEVPVLAVRYRAFVFAAPQCFVTGNRPMECRGAVSVGKVSSASQLLQQKFLALL